MLVKFSVAKNELKYVYVAVAFTHPLRGENRGKGQLALNDRVSYISCPIKMLL